MTNKQLTMVKSLLAWIAYYWFPNVPNVKPTIETWLDQVAIWGKQSGTLWTIARIKDLRLIYTKYISGEPFKVFPGRVGLNAKGLPKATPYFNLLIEAGSREQIQFVLTCLSISRAIPGTKDPSTTSITSPSTKDSTIISELTAHLPTFLNENGIRSDYQLSWTPEKLRLSNKAGPEGRATLFSWRDAVVLPISLLDSIQAMSPRLGSYILKLRESWPRDIVVKAHQRLKHNIKTFWHESRTAYEAVMDKDRSVWSKGPTLAYETIVSMYNSVFVDKELIRKLSIIEDPEAKARVIAIFDYWSQEVLKGVHDLQFNILKECLSQDRTFTQDPIIKDKDVDHHYHSVDLTAATDRFPIEIQEEMVAALYGNREFAKHWRSILVDYEFYVPWNKTFVKYNAGQPMGAYSSWSTFSLCHHLVVSYAAKLAGISNPKQYILLGDDIVIYHDEIARHYKDIMLRLGVDCSPHKTHTSKTTYEFAKRWFREDLEITGIQLRGFLDTMSKYHLIYQMIYTLYKRGLHPRIGVTIPDLLVSLFKRVGIYSRERKSLRNKIEMLHAFRKFIDENNYDALIYKIKEIYWDKEFSLPLNQPGELQRLVHTYIYVSANALIQEGTANALNYESGLLTGSYFNKFAEALANPMDLWTSPTYLVICSPLYKATLNRLEALVSQLSNDNGDIKELIKVISLPDPRHLEQRASERILNAETALAQRFFAAFENHALNRPHSFDSNLSAEIARTTWRKAESKLLNRDRYRNYGLVL